MSREQELIQRIRSAISSGAPARGELRLGIGDDAAVLRPPRRAHYVVSCDAFLEDVHFLAGAHAPEVVGYKALARAASDLAAMGAAPRFFLLSLALPPRRTRAWLDRFLAGMARAARKYRLRLIGGDTSQHPTVAIAITVIGQVEPGRAVSRAGARPSDLIFVSGTLGAAQLGLELVLRGLDRNPRWRTLLQRHLYPELRVALGQWLARRRLASAMIDTSDGLSTDLARLSEASRAGARVWRASLPLVRVPDELQARRGTQSAARALDPLTLALHGGEDYELLFTVPRRLARKIPRAWRGVPLTRIGEITRARKILLVDSSGRSRQLPPLGWDHFR